MTVVDAGARGEPVGDAVLRVDSVTVRLGGHRRRTRRGDSGQVLKDVTLEARLGEIVGIIGETGSGKTTLARTVMGIIRPEAGAVFLDGGEISTLKGRARRNLRRSGQLQLVFQDPLRSLDPDLRVGDIVAEGLDIAGTLGPEERRRAIESALREVGLDPNIAERRPAQISGGQRQRVSIARAIVSRPKVLICDEPVSALDASTRNYILKILGDLRGELDLSMIVISHDLVSLAAIADRVAVLYRGRIVEQGPIADVFGRPAHPYTALLIASAPSVSRARWNFDLEPHDVQRSPEDDEDLPVGAGCVFAPRCRFADATCRRSEPVTVDVGPDRGAACHHATSWREIVLSGRA